MKYYISITIGRNIGSQPMTLNDWKRFRRDVRDCITGHQVFNIKNGIIFEGEGQGFWAPDYEDSHAFVFLQEIEAVDDLRRDLAKIGQLYNQEAIGCAVVPLPQGDETLIDCT